ncbi:hypothetical protein FF011L_14760 [Roseimaritima multifibrata]|uniref:SLA1 homology domain-containing protein n=1 Tax=Roseimaritima multifibrata TaxID=1930274 RepID=A0A517MD68_9BACT|nr:SHD1 domain-containing protein [Roseimaritima multifibrata]QDS92727.1 hypothetical protein FF011L_14760 [Roseimaritima multifibrata]
MHNLSYRRPAFLLAFGLMLCAPLAFADTWTDSTGKYRVEGTFESLENGVVHIRTPEGKLLSVPLNRLDAASAALAKQNQAKMAPANPGTANGATKPAGNATAAQSKLGPNPTAAETAQVVSQAAADFDLVTLWDSMPPTYQQDVAATVRLQVAAVNANTWNGIKNLIQQLGTILQTKQELMMNNPTLQAILPADPKTNQTLAASGDLLLAISSSPLTDRQAMLEFDTSTLLAEDFSDIRSAFQKLSTSAGDLQGTPFTGMADVPKVVVLSETDNEAMVQITAGEKVTEQAFTKVENRWVPADMAANWKESIAEAQATAEKLKTPEGQQQMAQINMGLMVVGAPVQQLAAAQTQEQFDQVIESVQQMVGSMMPKPGQ